MAPFAGWEGAGAPATWRADSAGRDEAGGLHGGRNPSRGDGGNALGYEKQNSHVCAIESRWCKVRIALQRRESHSEPHEQQRFAVPRRRGGR